MTAAVTVTVSELSDVLLVPNRAVRSLDEDRVVYVLRSGASVPVQVRLGRSSDTFSQVLEGDLKEGDLIVLNPQTDFQFGPGGQGGPGGGAFFGKSSGGGTP
jgi:HlyD family secretion protein